MRTEYTRQTRWEQPPELVDPARIPAGSPYVREWVWMPCTNCDLQVHAPRARRMTNGVDCPECGRRLAAPLAAGDEAIEVILEAERQLTEEWMSQEVPCSD